MLYPTYKHSAFAGNLWIGNQSAFIYRYGLMNWGKDNPRMMMGKVAERVAREALLNNISPEDASKQAEKEFNLHTAGEVTKETDKVGPITANFVRELSKLGFPIPHEGKQIVEIEGLSYKVSLELDFSFGNYGIVDTKATLAVPSEPRPDNVRQCALYAKILKRPVSLLYASDKKVFLRPLTADEIDQGYNDLVQAWKQIERWQDKFATPQEAIKYVPLCVDTYHFDDEDVPKARALWDGLCK